MSDVKQFNIDGTVYDVKDATARSSVNTLAGSINTALSNFAPAFNSSASYSVGDMCTRGGVLYRCTTSHTGAWDSSHFEKTDVESVTDNLSSEVNAIVNVYGSKNLFPGFTSDYSGSFKNIIVTCNSDGTVLVTNNGSSAYSNPSIDYPMNVSFPYDVILSGCPSGGAENTYRMDINISNLYDTGNGVVIPANTTITKIRIRIESGYTPNNLLFKPMLRLASDTDATYQPYAMTNRELTTRSYRRTRRDITNNLANLSTAVAAQDLGAYGYAIGDYFTGASGYTYFLADMNTFKGTATPYCISSNHIGIVVDTHATSAWQSSGDVSSTGYAGSTLHSYLSGTVLDNIKSDFTALFGGWSEHLLSHTKLFTTALAGWAYSANQYISALTCTQADAGSQWTANSFQEGEASKSLELFRKYKWTEIYGGEYPWLRNLSNYSGGTYACYLSHVGYLNGGLSVADSGFVSGLIIFH